MVQTTWKKENGGKAVWRDSNGQLLHSPKTSRSFSTLYEKNLLALEASLNKKALLLRDEVHKLAVKESEMRSLQEMADRQFEALSAKKRNDILAERRAIEFSRAKLVSERNAFLNQKDKWEREKNRKDRAISEGNQVIEGKSRNVSQMRRNVWSEKELVAQRLVDIEDQKRDLEAERAGLSRRENKIGADELSAKNSLITATGVQIERQKRIDDLTKLLIKREEEVKAREDAARGSKALLEQITKRVAEKREEEMALGVDLDKKRVDVDSRIGKLEKLIKVASDKENSIRGGFQKLEEEKGGLRNRIRQHELGKISRGK